MHLRHPLLLTLFTLLPFSLAAPKGTAPNVYSCYQCESPDGHDGDYYVVLPDGNFYCNRGFQPCAGVGTPSEAPGYTSHPAKGQCQLLLTQYANGTDTSLGTFGAGFLDDKYQPMGNTPNMTLSMGEKWTLSTAFGPTITVWWEGNSSTNVTMWFYNELTKITYFGGATEVVGVQYANPGLVNRYYTKFDCGPVVAS